MEKIQAHVSVRAFAANPLAGFRHVSLPVPEWDGVTVIVRAPSPGDHIFHVRAIWAAAGIVPGESDESAREKLNAPATDYTRASAALLVRTLFEAGTDGSVTRVFADDDVGHVAAAYGPVHARLVAKAIELGNLGEGAAEVAKKPSRKRRASGS